MKKKLTIVGIITLLILNINIKVLATDRLVDIPVPPNSSGYADFTEEEAAQRQEEYEKTKNNTTAEDYIEKSNNNYLKSLSIEGYNLEPEFKRENDTYTIYIKNREDVTNLDITAEADNESAKIDGIGTVQITPEQNSININVTAENGNLKIYKINIQEGENEESKEKTQIAGINIEYIVAIVIILFIIIFISVLKNKRRVE